MGRKKKKQYRKYKESPVCAQKDGKEKKNVQDSLTAEPNININVNLNVNRNTARSCANTAHVEENQDLEVGTGEKSVLKRALNRSTTKFVEDLNPLVIVDQFITNEFLTAVEARDIKELDSTSNKNRTILKKVVSKGDRGVKLFKEALKKSGQHELVNFLEGKEREVELERENLTERNPFQSEFAGSAGQPVEKIEEPSVLENSSMSYAEVVSGQTEDNVTCIVNYINVQKKEPVVVDKGCEKYAEVQKFHKAVANFKGDFILLLDKYENVQNLEALALVPWTAVLDFDPKSRCSGGVLSRVENDLKIHRSLHILSIQNKSNVTEQSTNWIFMLGCHDYPDSLTSVQFKKWRKEINTAKFFYYHLQKLKEFGEAYTHFTLLIIWPKSTDRSKHVQFAVTELEECLSPMLKIVLVFEDPKQSDDNDPVLDDFKNDSDITKVYISLQDMCGLISSQFSQKQSAMSMNFQLPDNEAVPSITEDKAQWLSEDLEVIYLNNNTGISYEENSLHSEEDQFFKGGTLQWAWWYQVGPGHLDIERDIFHEIVEYIRKYYVLAWKSGIITLYHAPGAGGTTLAQRVLWTLRKEVPCAQLKRGSSSSILELTERIRFLCDKTSKPVFILIDGEDHQRVDSVQRSLREHCVIIFYVKRYPYRISKNDSRINEGKIWLNSGVSKKEAAVLGLKYTKQCKSSQKTEAIRHLVKEVEIGKFHSIFDFGLCLHNYEYKGIESYVKGYLRLDESDNAELKPWQTAIAYLALVYYYGQTSLPCFFLSCILNAGQHKILLFEELPKEMSEFIVREINDAKKNVVRISHYLIAKEILDQILTKGKEVKRPPSPTICEEAKKMLSKFAIQFIRTTGEINKGSLSNMLCRTMTRTFISRDNKVVGESETQATRSKRPKLSQILEDVCSNAPYTERFMILQQLTDSFPHEPQFRAHLGRLYTLCRSEEEEKAEKCFKEALDMCQREVAHMQVEDIPYAKRQDLRNIYHMYGNMFVLRIAKYTGRYLGDMPVKDTDVSNFHKRAEDLLDSVSTACSLFFQCRDITPPGCEESFGYIGEIQVRLMFCDFINSRCEEGNLHKYVENNINDIAGFVEDCYTVLDELFIECFSAIEPEKMDNTVMNCTEWYAALFNTTPTHGMSRLASRDDVYSRRLNIVTMKMKYSSRKSFGVLELINNQRDIRFIVKGYEKNFAEYEVLDDQRLSRRAIDIDYREWLFAIRHHLFQEHYEIDAVLLHVQAWYDRLHTPYSRFYLFVLKSLLGIGVSKGTSNPRLLLQAQELKEDVLKYSKYMAKPKYPREWLGPPTTTIRRLAQGKRFFGQIEGRDADRSLDSDFEVRTGTISPPNDKPASGMIYLDLGLDNNVTVKVFFVPARCEMKGTSYQGSRVEFQIGFSMSHGYEAFNVKLLGHVICEKCRDATEIRSCDTAVQCYNCKAEIKRKAK